MRIDTGGHAGSRPPAIEEELASRLWRQARRIGLGSRR